jgi:nicotinamide-nucleotide amidase
MKRVSEREIEAAATSLLALCRERGLKVATAESCTGGLVAGALTEIPGSSDVVERGFVTYSNEAKHEMLGVPWKTLKTYGAVSQETADRMAKGALARSTADIAVSITGIAGPGGATPGKPVGLVYFAAAVRGRGLLHCVQRFGKVIGRRQVRLKSVMVALQLVTSATQLRSA